MKKLFLMISLLTTSIHVSANECVQPLTFLTPLKLQLVPYIYQTLNSDVGTDIGVIRLRILQKLIGLEVRGWHRAYPEGKTYKKRAKVDGVVQNVQLIKPGDTGEEIYEMTIHSEENGQQKFSFSGSYSPTFSTLETTSLSSQSPLAVNARDAEKTIISPFDLLSVGLDTLPEVASYKESFRAQGAVVFYGSRYPFYEFSNFYEVPIVIDGEIWPSTEHYFQAQKFLNSETDIPGEYVNEHVMNVRIAKSPARAARMGRDRSLPLRSDWEDIKDEVMFKALAAKFTQHKDLYDLLISTEDALIVEHTEKDRYWGDGENGRGKSMLGNLLMRLRDQLRQRVMPGYELPMAAVWGQLLGRIEDMSQHFNVEDAYNLARQIAFSDISDIEKIDKMQMILDSAHFLRESNRYLNQTSSSEWITLINKKYPEDMNFRYQLVKIGLSLAGPLVLITDLRPLNISDNQQMEIYKIMARGSPEFFMSALPDRFGLDHSKIRELYLYTLQFESSLLFIKRLPRDIVNDAFIQEVVDVLHKNRFPTQYHLSVERSRTWRGKIIKDLIKAASFHELNYSAVYAFDNKPVNEPNENDRRNQPDIYPPRDQDPIELTLINS